MVFGRIKKVVKKKSKKKGSNLTSNFRSLSITSGTDFGSSVDIDDPIDTDIRAPLRKSMPQSRLEESYQKSEREKEAAFAKIKELEDKLLKEAYQKAEREKAAAFLKIKELEEKLSQQAKEDIDHIPSVIDVSFDSNTSQLCGTNENNEKYARDLSQLNKKDYTICFDGSKSYIRTDDDTEISARNLVQCLRSVKSNCNESIGDVCSEISLSSSRRGSPSPPRLHRQEISGSASIKSTTRRGGRRPPRPPPRRGTIASTSLLETQVMCF